MLGGRGSRVVRAERAALTRTTPKVPIPPSPASLPGKGQLIPETAHPMVNPSQAGTFHSITPRRDNSSRGQFCLQPTHPKDVSCSSRLGRIDHGMSCPCNSYHEQPIPPESRSQRQLLLMPGTNDCATHPTYSTLHGHGQLVLMPGTSHPSSTGCSGMYCPLPPPRPFHSPFLRASLGSADASSITLTTAPCPSGRRTTPRTRSRNVSSRDNSSHQ